MTIKEFSKKVDISSYTLRYYEKIGILADVKRKSNGIRDYNENDLKWVAFVKRLKESGMSVNDIKEILNLRRIGDSTISERLAILEKHKLKIEEDLKKSTGHLEVINDKISIYKNYLKK